jgi:CheY-like chemotaxis protein
VLLKRAPDAFDLIITDQTMPKLTGSDLLSYIRAIRTDLPVIISSGFSSEKLPDGGAGVTSLLPKPYTPEELLTAVRAALTIH